MTKRFQISEDIWCIQMDEYKSGGFGTIYNCMLVHKDGSLMQDELVIKRLSNTFSMVDPHRFEREMKYLRQLSHKNIMQPVHTNSIEEYIIMEKHPYNLEEYILENDFTKEELLNIFKQILEGVKYLIDEGILHRDLKPQNILISKNEQVIITDFGLSSRMNKNDTTYQLTKTGHTAGTQFYTAPEQLKDLSEADEISEIFSLGRILYSMFTQHFDLIYPASTNSLDPTIRHIIRKSTDNDREKRYQNINEVISQVSLLFPKESPFNIKDLELSQIIEEINRKITLGDKDSNVFHLINNQQFEEADELFVTLDEDIHKGLWSIDSVEYNIFINRASEIISQNSYIFSYVDKIATSSVKILNTLGDNLDIDAYVNLVSAVVIVSTYHNRFFAMKKIGAFINNMEELRVAELKETIEAQNLYSNYNKVNNYCRLNILSDILDSDS